MSFIDNFIKTFGKTPSNKIDKENTYHGGNEPKDPFYNKTQGIESSSDSRIKEVWTPWYEEAMEDSTKKYMNYKEKNEKFKDLTPDEVKEALKFYAEGKMKDFLPLQDPEDYRKKKDFSEYTEAEKMALTAELLEHGALNPAHFEDYLLSHDYEPYKTVEFSYEPGDTFGQKILDLGIATDNGLWGEDGDVAYYTQQLRDGGYLDDYGNVKLYTPIKLKVRK